MKPSTTLFGLFAIFPLVECIAFGGPQPTATSPERGLAATCPKPTKGPSISELRKRQPGRDPAVCGWVDGDYSSAVSCLDLATCMLYKSAAFGMAGCCVGGDSQNCGWAKSCLDYSAYRAGSCTGDCQFNTFVRKCTNVFSPACVTFTYPSDGIVDYGCAPSSIDGTYTVRQRATDGLGDTTSITLPTVSGKAVTGFTGAATGGSSQSTYTPSDDTPTTTTKKVPVRLIIIIIIVVLFILFVAAVGTLICLKKKKKQKQIAANAQAVATAQANRPDSMHPSQPQMQQAMPNGYVPPPAEQQNGFVPPVPSQTPQPPANGYFSPPGQNDQKFAHNSVYEYPQTPISNPATPAPAYSHPYGAPNAPAAVPPMPGQPNAQAFYHPPAEGVHEVGGGNVTQPPQQQGLSPIAQSNVPANSGTVYEMGPSQQQGISPAAQPHTPANTGAVYEMGSGR